VVNSASNSEKKGKEGARLGIALVKTKGKKSKPSQLEGKGLWPGIKRMKDLGDTEMGQTHKSNAPGE